MSKSPEMNSGEESKESEAKNDTIDAAPQEWQDFKVEFDEVHSRLLEKIFNLDKEKSDHFFQRMLDMQKQAFASVPDPYRYLSYHRALSGGTGPISSPKLDFEGEHSLLEGYRQLLEEMEQI